MERKEFKEFVLANYQTMTKSEMAEATGRRYDDVYTLMRRFELDKKKDEKEGIYNDYNVCPITGIKEKY